MTILSMNSPSGWGLCSQTPLCVRHRPILALSSSLYLTKSHYVRAFYPKNQKNLPAFRPLFLAKSRDATFIKKSQKSANG